jgi:hypothetical protein
MEQLSNRSIASLCAEALRGLESPHESTFLELQACITRAHALLRFKRSAAERPRESRAEFWAAICNLDPILSARKHHSINGLFCLAEVMSLAALRLTFLFGRSPDKTATDLYNNSVDVAPTKFVSHYSQAEYISALQRLRAVFITTVYSQRLLTYSYALEIRGAELIFQQWSESTLCLPKFRMPVAESTIFYETNDVFNTLVWTTFCGINTAFLRIPDQLQFIDMPPPSDETLQTIERVKTWLLEKAGAIDDPTPSTALRAHFAALCIRPGDIQSARFRGKITSDVPLYVCAERQSIAEMGRINEVPRTPFHVIILQQLPKLKPCVEQESAELGLALADMIDMFLKNTDFFAKYCAPHLVVQRRWPMVRALGKRWPVLVQVFHHWQLLANDQIYVTNSFMWAFSCFLGTIKGIDAHAGILNALMETELGELLKLLP